MDLRSQLVKQKANAEVLEKELKARRLEVRSLELQLRNSEHRDSDYTKELDALRAQMVCTYTIFECVHVMCVHVCTSLYVRVHAYVYELGLSNYCNSIHYIIYYDSLRLFVSKLLYCRKCCKL